MSIGKAMPRGDNIKQRTAPTDQLLPSAGNLSTADGRKYITGDIANGPLDGTNNRFVLNAKPIASTLEVFRNGIFQLPGQDYIAGTDIDLEFMVPPVGGRITANYFVDEVAIRVGDVDQITYNEVPGGAVDGVNTTYSLLNAPEVMTLQVVVHGIMQTRGVLDDYVVNNNQIIFNTPIPAGRKIVAHYYKSTGANISVVDKFVVGEMPQGVVDGVNAVFTFLADIKPGSMRLYENGIFQLEGAGNAYTISGGNVVTFFTPPPLTRVISGSYIST